MLMTSEWHDSDKMYDFSKNIIEQQSEWGEKAIASIWHIETGNINITTNQKIFKCLFVEALPFFFRLCFGQHWFWALSQLGLYFISHLSAALCSFTSVPKNPLFNILKAFKFSVLGNIWCFIPDDFRTGQLSEGKYKWEFKGCWF